MKETAKAFTNHKANGVYLKFDNGNSISTIWSSGSYTDNHDWEHPSGDISKNYSQRIEEGSNDVEIMVECSPVVFELLESKYSNESAGGSVFGHLSLEQWLDILDILKRNPNLPAPSERG